MKRTLLVIGLIVALSLAGVSLAAEQKASKGTYMRLMDVQKAWEKEEYNKAFAELEEALVKAAGKPFDIATIQQYKAHTSILAGRDELARPALETALRQPGLPLQMIADLKLFLGQIVLGDEEFELARDLLEDWITTTESTPQPANYFSLAYAHYQTKNLPKAEGYIEQAIAAAPRPNPSWYQVYYQVLFEQKKFSKALIVLQDLLNQKPGDKRYWRMLANHYMQVEESKRALAAMSIAYNAGMLTETADLRRVASLYSYVEVPNKAARLLEQWIAEDRIKEDPETLRQLGDLWMLSRDRPKAKIYLKRAAAVSKDPSAYELLGSLNFEDEEWRDAHSNFMAALEFEGRRDEDGDLIVDEPLRIHMLAGISAMRAGMNAEARRSLNRATEDRKLRGQARALLAELD